MYKFAILDPRSILPATLANDALFASGPVYGVEVTIPALASRCVTNIDPQHTGGDPNKAAIEVALTSELPPDGSTLATVRADLDSIGAMALLSLRLKRVHLTPMLEAMTPETSRFDLVAQADKFARGGYTGPKPLPTRDNPWPEGGTAESSQPLAAIAAAVADFRVPLATRVATMERWLFVGEEPMQYRAQVNTERLDLITALENGQINARDHHVWDLPQDWCEQSAPDQKFHRGVIALVESTHRAATMVGYALAPVVIALNPKFRFQGGPEHCKFTVCQYESGHCDLKAVLTDLQKLEAGWGGSPTIIGSPQGAGSTLTLQQVTEVVARHLKKK